MNIMKTFFTRRYLAPLLILLLLAAGWLLLRPSSYELPFAESDVASVTFCWDHDEMKRKETADPTDISLIYTALCELSLRGRSKEIVYGGQSFVLVFHLKDGTDWACDFFQTSAEKGFLTDENGRWAVRYLDLKQLWPQLRSQAVPATRDEINALYGLVG